MDIQQVRKNIQLQVIKQQLEDLKTLRKEGNNSLLYSDSHEQGFLIQQSHGVWEYKPEIDSTNIITAPVSFPYIYPHIYKVETGNKIPRKTAYSIKDVTVNYAAQLIPFF